MKHKILIVDDDIDDQVLLTETLIAIDPFCECDSVGNGFEALTYLTNTNTLPSFILLDLNMPLMNGYIFLEKVKEIDDFKDIPIAIFSTSKSSRDILRTKDLGAKFFFTKSNNIEGLKADLVKVLSSKSKKFNGFR